MDLDTLNKQTRELRAKLKELSARRAVIRSHTRKKVDDPELSQRDRERFAKDRLYHKNYYRRVLRAKRNARKTIPKATCLVR